MGIMNALPDLPNAPSHYISGTAVYINVAHKIHSNGYATFSGSYETTA